MSNTLYLSLPIDSMIAPKPRSDDPVRGQAYCAEPTMVEALEAAVVRYQAADDPRWLALLSAWLHAVGLIRMKHLLRSEPLKVTGSTYYAWCSKCKQKHNRKGFRWTCPSKFTTIPFDWAAKFVELWQGLPLEKQSIGMVFHTAKMAPLTFNACNEVVKEALAHWVVNPEKITTYSWRRVMPSLALSVKLSPAEAVALGDWQDKSTAGPEAKRAAMPLHYADTKESTSKRLKHVMAIILGKVMRYETWEGIPEGVLRSIRSHPDVQADLAKTIEADTRVVWRRANIMQITHGFVLRKGCKRQHEGTGPPEPPTGETDQFEESDVPTAPKMPKLSSKVLSSKDKAGAMLCAAYQAGRCNDGVSSLSGTSCAGGKHVCAIVCKSGRVCGLRHTAADCVNKKAAHPEMAVPKPRTAESPRIELSQPTEKEDITRWRAPTPLPSGSSGGRPWHRPPSGARQQDDMRAGDTRAASATADVQGEPPADQSSEAGKEDVWANRFDKLAIKSLRRGNKFRPEPPTLIAKICKSGGELWLGGLPTERYLPPAPEGGFALQVCCMKSAPEDRVIDDKKKGTFTRGVTMPNVILVKLNMDNPDAAARDWPSVSKLVVKSLRQGDNAFVHCMAGVHRAGLAGSMLRAHLHDETLDKAIATIKKVRHVEPEKCLVNHPRCRDGSEGHERGMDEQTSRLGSRDEANPRSYSLRGK